MATLLTQKPERVFYQGRAIDRFPDSPFAGVESVVGKETVAQCLTFPKDKPPTPDPVMRLKQWTSTPMEKHRIFHAQYYDPELERSRTMIHGMGYPKGPSAADLINPIPKSVYQQRYNDRLESIYDSNKRKPLGTQPDPELAFPGGFNYRDTIFGIKNTFNGTVKECVNPDKSVVELHNENQDDHDYYLKSHRHFYPGEQARRGYSAHPRFAKMDYFGMPTPCNREGLLTKSCLRWHTDKENEKITPLVDKRLEDFRERYTPQVGLSLDPIKDTMNVAPGHVFGMKSQPDLYKVGDLIHGKIPYYFNTGPHRERAVMGAIRNHLRALHYTHYKDIKDAFNLLDKDKSGYLSEQQVRQVCQQFDLPVDPQLFEQVLDICEENKKINWQKFANNFNWQERVDFYSIKPDYTYSGDPCVANEADFTLHNRLQRETEREIGNWTTSNSMYNGGGILKDVHFPALGAATIRTDLPIPKVRKATDKTSYGIEGRAPAVVNPSIMASHGITELDLLIPRKKEELQKLYDGLYASSNNEEVTTDNSKEFPGKLSSAPATFDEVWQLTVDLSHQPNVTVTPGVINVDVFNKALGYWENLRIKQQVARQIPVLASPLADIMPDLPVPQRYTGVGCGYSHQGNE